MDKIRQESMKKEKGRRKGKEEDGRLKAEERLGVRSRYEIGILKLRRYEKERKRI